MINFKMIRNGGTGGMGDPIRDFDFGNVIYASHKHTKYIFTHPHGAV